MMSLLILQLSDWHLRADATDRTLEEHVPRLVEIANEYAGKASHCLIVLSGDLAYSGSADQYRSLSRILAAITKEVQSKLSARWVKCIAVPGNHDCDFGHESAVRRALLPQIVDDALEDDGSVIEQCTKPQEEFFAWLD
ncbi:MAG: metallophosphoesterase, partial [Chloroflexi bacterium]|nr:metallophosphoesterase [Chloroflexota bacterium]